MMYLTFVLHPCSYCCNWRTTNSLMMMMMMTMMKQQQLYRNVIKLQI